MILNSLPKSERKRIVFLGQRNVGKSSIINALIEQDICYVDETPGTTTDPFRKSLELIPYGPVMFIDTPGIDDPGVMWEKRMSAILKEISTAHFAVFVVNCCERLTDKEKEMLRYLDKISLPYLIVVNKIERGVSEDLLYDIKQFPVLHFEVSCKEKVGIDAFRKKMIRMLPIEETATSIKDIAGEGNLIFLISPDDIKTPHGKLLIPQIQVIREALDEDTIVVVLKRSELKAKLKEYGESPDLIISDSESIKEILTFIPDDIPVTTYNILSSRMKGDLAAFVKGLKKIGDLKDGDKVLVAEVCEKHDNEAEERLDAASWLKEYSGRRLKVTSINGLDFPDNLADYKLIINCNACMLSRNAMMARIKQAKMMDVPIVNYGMLIAFNEGIVPRTVAPFRDAFLEWNKKSFVSPNKSMVN
jgi:[FeFe] hydrogenase H-cluster maturation GTPase HydF